jgi:hypothetical protein
MSVLVEDEASKTEEILVHAKFLNHQALLSPQERKLAIRKLLTALNAGQDVGHLEERTNYLYVYRLPRRKESRCLFDCHLKRVYLERVPVYVHGCIIVKAYFLIDLGKPDATATVKIPVASIDFVWNEQVEGGKVLMEPVTIDQMAPLPMRIDEPPPEF